MFQAAHSSSSSPDQDQKSRVIKRARSDLEHNGNEEPHPKRLRSAAAVQANAPNEQLARPSPEHFVDLTGDDDVPIKTEPRSSHNRLKVKQESRKDEILDRLREIKLEREEIKLTRQLRELESG